MATNILGINPYNDTFFSVVENNLRNVFKGNNNIENIEIEIKYAQFKQFGPFIDERILQDPSMSGLTKKKIMDYAYFSNNIFCSSMNKLSYQRILYLNPLGRNTYNISAGFKEEIHKKYYHIREFLIKMCEAYKGENHHETMSIYRELRLNSLDKNPFIMVEENDIRLDIHIKDLQDLGGRYSYSIKAGKWVKVQKEALADQTDFLLCERAFRLAINRQIQTEVLPETMLRISQLLRAKPKLTDVRMKRLMRVERGKICSYDMSEIWNVNEVNKNIDPNFYASIVLPTEELNLYIRKQFINFYSLHEQNHIKFEIEAEFKPHLVGVLKKHIQENNSQKVKYEIQRTINELYALFFCDHATKVRQIPWLNRKVAQNNNTLLMPDARLENEYGNYMRSELYETMNYYG